MLVWCHRCNPISFLSLYFRTNGQLTIVPEDERPRTPPLGAHRNQLKERPVAVVRPIVRPVVRQTAPERPSQQDRHRPRVLISDARGGDILDHIIWHVQPSPGDISREVRSYRITSQGQVIPLYQRTEFSPGQREIIYIEDDNDDNASGGDTVVLGGSNGGVNGEANVEEEFDSGEANNADTLRVNLGGDVNSDVGGDNEDNEVDYGDNGSAGIGGNGDNSDRIDFVENTVADDHEGDFQGDEPADNDDDANDDEVNGDTEVADETSDYENDNRGYGRVDDDIACGNGSTAVGDDTHSHHHNSDTDGDDTGSEEDVDDGDSGNYVYLTYDVASNGNDYVTDSADSTDSATDDDELENNSDRRSAGSDGDGDFDRNAGDRGNNSSDENHNGTSDSVSDDRDGHTTSMQFYQAQGERGAHSLTNSSTEYHETATVPNPRASAMTACEDSDKDEYYDKYFRPLETKNKSEIRPVSRKRCRSIFDRCLLSGPEEGECHPKKSKYANESSNGHSFNGGGYKTEAHSFQGKRSTNALHTSSVNSHQIMTGLHSGNTVLTTTCDDTDREEYYDRYFRFVATGNNSEVKKVSRRRCRSIFDRCLLSDPDEGECDRNNRKFHDKSSNGYSVSGSNNTTETNSFKRKRVADALNTSYVNINQIKRGDHSGSTVLKSTCDYTDTDEYYDRYFRLLETKNNSKLNP